MIVRTFDGVQSLAAPTTPTWMSGGGSGINHYGLYQSYDQIYRDQPNVRICVDFLARNVAELAPQVFHRKSDTDRERVYGHQVEQWLSRPNPATVRYRLFEGLMSDMGIYFDAYWLKVRYVNDAGQNAIGLVRLPPSEMQTKGILLPSTHYWLSQGRRIELPLSEVVHFSGYNPSLYDRFKGLSPIETLGRIVAEEYAAGEHRESYWRNSARVSGVVTRPKDKPRYTKEQVADWRQQWNGAYTGSASNNTVLLQDGEEFKETSWSPKDSEYIEGGKLRRAVCAAQYGIPLPMVGILEHATFSNIEEQHRNLYQDCLGGWLEMIRQELQAQLLVESDDQDDIYIEFDLDKKLAGTPNERAVALRLAIGRPWRTVNEGRGLENLPSTNDPADDKVAPQQGGPSDASVGGTRLPAEEAALIEPILNAARRRQLDRLQKVAAADRPAALFASLDRYTRELVNDLSAVLTPEGASAAAARANVELYLQLQEDRR